MVKVGDRIEVVSTTSIKLEPGDKGDVMKIERTGTEQYVIWVNWEEKGTVPLIEGDDRFKVISTKKDKVN
jgi:urease beta subunit